MSAWSEGIGFLMADVSRLMRRRFEAALDAAGLDLTAGEARVLYLAAILAPVRQTLLAERLAVEPMTLVGYLDRLEQADLIRREADPADRRAKRVRITAAAEPLIARIAVIAAAVRAEATDGLTPADQDALAMALARMRTNLEPIGAPA